MCKTVWHKITGVHTSGMRFGFTSTAVRRHLEIFKNSRETSLIGSKEREEGREGEKVLSNLRAEDQSEAVFYSIVRAPLQCLSFSALHKLMRVKPLRHKEGQCKSFSSTFSCHRSLDG